MRKSELEKRFNAIGFELIGTGGGCTAYAREFFINQTQFEILITVDGDACHPTRKNQKCCVGLYTPHHCSEGWGHYQTMTADKFLRHSQIVFNQMEGSEQMTIDLTPTDFIYVAYQEEDQLSVGVKSNKPFTGSETDDNIEYYRYQNIHVFQSFTDPSCNLKVEWEEDKTGWQVTATNFNYFIEYIKL